MRTFFDPSIAEYCTHKNMHAHGKSGVCRALTSQHLSNEDQVIQLELSITTARRLISENKLLGEDFHCLNQSSKILLKKVFLVSSKNKLKV